MTQPDTQTPESQTPESQTPESQTPESQTPESQTPESQTPHFVQWPLNPMKSEIGFLVVVTGTYPGAAGIEDDLLVRMLESGDFPLIDGHVPPDEQDHNETDNAEPSSPEPTETQRGIIDFELQRLDDQVRFKGLIGSNSPRSREGVLDGSVLDAVKTLLQEAFGPPAEDTVAVNARHVSWGEDYTHALVLPTFGDEYAPPAVAIALTEKTLRLFRQARAAAATLPDTLAGVVLDGDAVHAYITVKAGRSGMPRVAPAGTVPVMPVSTQEQRGTGLGSLSLVITPTGLRGFANVGDDNATGSGIFELYGASWDVLEQAHAGFTVS